MITTDRALAVAREHLTKEVSVGGLVTLYRFSDHWMANCSFPEGRGIDRAENRWIKISAEDGSVTVEQA